MVKIELKIVFKVPILVHIDAANSVSVELKLMELYLYFTLIKTAKKVIFFHQTINLDVYFHLTVHKIPKINVHKSKSNIYLPWLQLESHRFARFLGSVTGPQLVLAALCPPPPPP